MRVAVRKVEGVESVEVSLEKASADIRLRPDNRVTLAALRQIVKSNGFNAKEASVTAVGTLSDRAGQIVLTVSGTDSTLLIARTKSRGAAYTNALDSLTTRPSVKMEAVGIVTASTNPNQPDEFAIESIAPVAK
ncbi:MAG TPA: heavy metal-associated domain-containing protein [Vicinamibacterales bacterium]